MRRRRSVRQLHRLFGKHVFILAAFRSLRSTSSHLDIRFWVIPTMELIVENIPPFPWTLFSSSDVHLFGFDSTTSAHVFVSSSRPSHAIAFVSCCSRSSFQTRRASSPPRRRGGDGEGRSRPSNRHRHAIRRRVPRTSRPRRLPWRRRWLTWT